MKHPLLWSTLIYLGAMLFAAIAFGQTSEPPLETIPTPPPGAHELHEETTCGPILQKFDGFQLVEAHINPETLVLAAMYLKIYDSHHWALKLMSRAECNGVWSDAGTKDFDPAPKKCPVGECV